MVESHPLENPSAQNERSLKTLQRTLKLSQGRFSLILVRCSYAILREQMRRRLHQESSIEIQELVLSNSSKTLYSDILNLVKDKPPKPLMVFGLESVVALDELLTAGNRVRDKFREDFTFPIVLWVTDEVLRKLGRLASDLNSWATLVEFRITPDDLINFLRQKAEEALTDASNFTLNNFEFEAIRENLPNFRQESDPEIEAYWEFIQGKIDYKNNQLDAAILHYRRSLVFWQQSDNLEREGILLLNIGLAYYRQGEQQRIENRPFWENARNALQQCLEKFEMTQRPDLVVKHISKLGEVLRRLQDWEQLQNLANKALPLHQQYKEQSQIAQDYGFLAEVALEESRWDEANQLTRQALEVLENLSPNPSPDLPPSPLFNVPPFSRGARGDQTLSEQYSKGVRSDLCWLLARSLRHSGQINEAIETLEKARNESQPQFDAKQYILILEDLRQLYFQQNRYEEAFDIKLEQRQIKTKYRFQAFIGAGRLQPPQQAIELALELQRSPSEIIKQIVAASGRELDIKRLIDRIERPASKLSVIYGQSGVGKSSILQAGLVPTLKFTPIHGRDVLPILVTSYHDLLGDCGQLLAAGIQEIKGVSISASINTQEAILEQLQENQDRNLWTVLIFDQFEEFFFVDKDAASRRRFYEFLSECMKIDYLKIILSLREDYLYFLLECNRKNDLAIIDNDILSKNILYYLGNFSKADAKNVIKTLTQSSQFNFDDDFVDALVEDLASELGDVRPIELQVVGVELEERQITTLNEYQKLGSEAKEKLVEYFLAEVVTDCGNDNKETAALVLYLLTDENNTRPQKTQAELAGYLGADLSKLELVLNIFVKSGLVLLVPANPNKRYQLVHDYLVLFIRKQQGAELLEKYKLAEAERIRLATENQILAEARQKAEQLSVEAQRTANRRIGIGTAILGVSLVLAATVMGLAWQQVTKAQKFAELERLGTDTLRQFQYSNEQIQTLISALQLGQEVKYIGKNKSSLTDYPVSSPIFALQQILDTIQQRNRFKGHQEDVWSVSFSPDADGKHIATASADGTARLWDLQGKLLQEFKGHRDWVWSVSFSPDGKYIATASGDKTARLWDLQGNLLQEFKGHQGSVRSVTFSPDGKYIATGSLDKNARLWDLQGNLLQEFKGHQKIVRSVSFSPDSKYIATASGDATARLWDLQGKLLQEFKGHQAIVNSVSFSPDGKYIATASGDATARLWNLKGKLIEKFIGHQDAVMSVSFTPDGNSIATASIDYSVRLWNLQGKPIREFRGHQDGANSVSFSPDGKYLATASGDNTARLWELQRKLGKEFKGHQGKVFSVSFSLDGQYIATGSYDNTARLWNLQGTLIREFKGHQGWVWSVSFSPDGKYIATASGDKTARLWDLQGKLIQEFKGHQSPLLSVSFSPNGQYIATASGDKTARLWDLQGKLIQEFKGHKDIVRNASFSPDGNYIATASFDRTARLWDLQGKLLQEFNGHQGKVREVSFSPDGKYIATASSDGTARLWDLKGKSLKEFKGHQGIVWSVSFSPDGKYIATASSEGTARLWDLNGRLLKEFKGHQHWVRSVTFSPDGKYIATASEDKTARLWRIESLDEMLVRGCDWLHDYLKNNADDSEKHVCDGIGTQN